MIGESLSVATCLSGPLAAQSDGCASEIGMRRVDQIRILLVSSQERSDDPTAHGDAKTSFSNVVQRVGNEIRSDAPPTKLGNDGCRERNDSAIHQVVAKARQFELAERGGIDLLVVVPMHFDPGFCFHRRSVDLANRGGYHLVDESCCALIEKSGAVGISGGIGILDCLETIAVLIFIPPFDSGERLGGGRDQSRSAWRNLLGGRLKPCAPALISRLDRASIAMTGYTAAL